MAIPVGVAWAAAAAAVALVLVQAVLEPASRRDDFEIAGSDELAKMPFAFVTFKPDARIADITAFLADNGATVLAGPAAGGVFKIGISATTVADYDRLVGLIAAQPFAETVVPGRKPGQWRLVQSGHCCGILGGGFRRRLSRVRADQRSEPHRRPTSTA